MRIEQRLIIPLWIIVIGNILTGIIKQSSVMDLVLYICPFIILSIALSIKKIKISNNITSIIMLIFSIFSIFYEDVTALNSIFFFTFSLYISINSKKLYWIYGAIYITLFVVKYAFIGSSETITHIGGFIFVFIIYQHYIHPKKSYTKVIEKDYLTSPIKKEIVDIVHLIIQGCEYHEISDKLELNITADRVRRKVNAEIKRLGFKNREHMIFFMTEKGIIKSISYDLDSKTGSHDTL